MGTRVVIAEDEAIIRLDLKELLTEEGYEVVADTGRGDEAIRLTEELQPDLVILDVKMPGLDGLSAAEKIAQGDRAVVVLTAFSQRDLVERARDAGALAYIVKPFQRGDLLPALEVAMGRHAEMKTLAEEVPDSAARSDARRNLDRAKSSLMDQHGMSEQDAWQYLQSQAASSGRKVVEVAADVATGVLTP